MAFQTSLPQQCVRTSKTHPSTGSGGNWELLSVIFIGKHRDVYCIPWAILHSAHMLSELRVYLFSGYICPLSEVSFTVRPRRHLNSGVRLTGGVSGMLPGQMALLPAGRSVCFVRPRVAGMGPRGTSVCRPGQRGSSGAAHCLRRIAGITLPRACGTRSVRYCVYVTSVTVPGGGSQPRDVGE